MAYKKSEGFKRFRSWVPLKRVTVDDKVWSYYEHGPREKAPLVMIPGASGTGQIFFKQFLSLCPKGVRIIAVTSPCYMTHDEWIKGFDRFLDAAGVDRLHLFGTALGGYLAQTYIQYRPSRIKSLVLCNSFCDTQYYADNAPCAGLFTWMPEFMLKRMILSNFPKGALETEIANSVDFMVDQLEGMASRELASKMTLNCTLGPLKPQNLEIPPENVTIIDSLDEVAIPEKLRHEVYKIYNGCKEAHLKTGGNFPYLSRPDEVNMHLNVHLRRTMIELRPSLKPKGDKEEEQEQEEQEEQEVRKPRKKKSPKEPATEVKEETVESKGTDEEEEAEKEETG